MKYFIQHSFLITLFISCSLAGLAQGFKVDGKEPQSVVTYGSLTFTSLEGRFTEDEDLSGTWTVSKRKPSSTYYYNEQGNLIKKELYDYRGNPMDITVYGYIDGDRAANTKSISYEYNPPPMMAPAAATQSERKRDPRYSSKYKYRFDDRGNLVEKEMYRNDGKLSMRYVYDFKDNQREELVYSSDGSLNQKSLSIKKP